MLHRISLKTESTFREIESVRKVPECREIWIYMEEQETCSLSLVDKLI